jgi:hypothetical protein
VMGSDGEVISENRWGCMWQEEEMGGVTSPSPSPLLGVGMVVVRDRLGGGEGASI